MKRFAFLPALLLGISACADSNPTVPAGDPAARGAVPVSAVAARADVVASASGQGIMHVGEQLASFQRIFEFKAVKYADGSAAGDGMLVKVSSNPDLRQQIRFSIDCMIVEGHMARMSGVVTEVLKSSAFDTIPVGAPFQFSVVDNGEGTRAGPDLMTHFANGNPGESQPPACWVNDGWELLPVVGNIQVRGATTRTMVSFYSDRSGNRDIYVMNPDGTGLTNLTNSPETELSSDWSPDGSRIVYMRGSPGKYHLRVMNVDGTDDHRLTDDGYYDADPAWSPDGRKIAFGGDRDGGGIFLINPDGSGLQHLAWNAGHPDWSPDGRKIVFHSYRDGRGAEIYVMNADGSNPVRLTDNWSDDINPAWSPDGLRIAFDSDLGVSGGPREIIVINADGSHATRLTDNDAFDTWPDWSPDGSRILFDSNRGQANPNNYDLYIMNADGSNPINVTNSLSHNARPEWSRYLPN